MTSENVESLYDLIDYLFDKMNIQVEMTEQNIIEYISNFSSKVINWVVISNTIKIILIIITLLISAIIMRRIIKKYNLFHKAYTGFKEEETPRLIIYSAILVVVFGFQLMLFVKCIMYIIQLIHCAIFPEKVVLEFINKYL